MSNDSNGTASSQDFDASTSYTGRVKWFNNKAGYGFITVCRSSADDRVGDDVFVHHSGIKVGSEQYKYLVQGEYVDFTLRSSDSGAHPTSSDLKVLTPRNRDDLGRPALKRQLAPQPLSTL